MRNSRSPCPLHCEPVEAGGGGSAEAPGRGHAPLRDAGAAAAGAGSGDFRSQLIRDGTGLGEYLDEVTPKGGLIPFDIDQARLLGGMRQPGETRYQGGAPLYYIRFPQSLQRSLADQFFEDELRVRPEEGDSLITIMCDKVVAAVAYRLQSVDGVVITYVSLLVSHKKSLGSLLLDMVARNVRHMVNGRTFRIELQYDSKFKGVEAFYSRCRFTHIDSLSTATPMSHRFKFMCWSPEVGTTCQVRAQSLSCVFMAAVMCASLISFLNFPHPPTPPPPPISPPSLSACCVQAGKNASDTSGVMELSEGTPGGSTQAQLKQMWPDLARKDLGILVRPIYC